MDKMLWHQEKKECVIPCERQGHLQCGYGWERTKRTWTRKTIWPQCRQEREKIACWSCVEGRPRVRISAERHVP